VAVQSCWRTSLQGTSLGKSWWSKGCWRVAERQDLSPSSHIMERKCQCQASEEDFLTNRKVKVRDDPDRPGGSSAKGEGRSRVMELDLPHSPPPTASNIFPQPVRTTPTKHTSLLCTSSNWCNCKLHTAWVS